MILTDKFVYIHFPKSGGTFVTKMLNIVHKNQGYKTKIMRLGGIIFGKTGGGIIDTGIYRNYGGQHTPCRKIPKSFQKRQVFSTIRNPYDLYVSYYKYGTWKNPSFQLNEKLSEIKKHYPNYPQISFSEYINVINKYGKFQEKLIPNLDSNSSIGWLSYFFIHMFFKEKTRDIFLKLNENYISSQKYKDDIYPLKFIHQENLNQELYEHLLTIGYKTPQINFILEANKVLPKLPEGGTKRQKQDWKDYYIPQLKEFVRTKERLLFSMFPEYDV